MGQSLLISTIGESMPALYNIPESLMAAYRGQNIILRTREASEMISRMRAADVGSIAYIQVLSPDGSIEGLEHWVPGIPLDVVIREPQHEIPLLYRFAPLLNSHPIRVSVALVRGFGKVVKLATSLNFAVKIAGGQPDPDVIGEMLDIVDFYLHRSNLTEPIEFFHGLFLGFYHQIPVTLWAIQEEDPASARYVTDQGQERMPGRLAAAEPPLDLASFASKRMNRIEKGECARCAFRLNCAGYFKWPRRDYGCDGVKAVMQVLAEAAGELRKDMADCDSRHEGNPA